MTPSHVITIDPRGRTTLPKAVRDALGTKGKTKSVALVLDGESIYLRQLPDFDKCIFCGGEPDQEHNGRWMCKECLAEIKVDKK